MHCESQQSACSGIFAIGVGLRLNCLSSEALSFVYLKFRMVETVLFCELQKCKGKVYLRFQKLSDWKKKKGRSKGDCSLLNLHQYEIRHTYDIQVNIWGPNFQNLSAAS